VPTDSRRRYALLAPATIRGAIDQEEEDAMADQHSLTPVTEQKLQTARTKGQVIGFAQGVGATLLVGVVLKFLGWIPFLVVGGAVAYLGYKLFFRHKGKEKDQE
jgi:hypothetical protein